MAIARQQHSAVRTFATKHLGHHRVARELAARHAGPEPLRQRAAMAEVDFALLRGLPGRVGQRVQAEFAAAPGAEHRLRRLAHQARGQRTRQVRGEQLQVELQRDGHQRLVVVPGPAVRGAGLGDQVLRIARPFAPAAFDVGLPVDVELLHHQRRAPTCLDRTAQDGGAAPVVFRVVVHLAEQRERATLQARFPGFGWARRGGTARQAGAHEPGHRGQGRRDQTASSQGVAGAILRSTAPALRCCGRKGRSSWGVERAGACRPAAWRGGQWVKGIAHRPIVRAGGVAQAHSRTHG